MKIDCFFTHQQFAAAGKPADTVMVIDVLRATSTIAIALANGAEMIIPVRNIDDALELKKQLPDAVLAGERKGEILDGFDIGNSPHEYIKENVEGKVIISCTTNGTAAIDAAKGSPAVFCGAIINAQAVADTLLAQNSDLVILCSGTDGQISYDDIIGAGAVIYKIYEKETDIYMSDAAKIAFQSYAINKQNILKGLQSSYHGDKLTRAGKGQDVIFCAKEDIVNITPVYRDGKIVKL